MLARCVRILATFPALSLTASCTGAQSELPMLRTGVPAREMSFSPDGKLLATPGPDFSVLLWEIPSGKQVAQLKDAGGKFLAFSPNGKLLASGDYSEVRTWDLTTRKQLMTFGGHTESIFDAAFSADGDTLATASRDKTVKLWQAQTGKELRVCKHEDDVLCVRFSPTGHLMASAGRDRTIRLWDHRDGKELAVLRGHNEEVGGLAFSPRGDMLASADPKGAVKTWDVRRGVELRAFEGHTRPVVFISFLSDKELIALDTTAHMVQWDVASGEKLGEGIVQRGPGLLSSAAVSTHAKVLATAGQAQGQGIVTFHPLERFSKGESR